MPRAAPKPTHVYTPTTDGGMDEYNSFDVPSPSNSLYYNMYADADQYLESHTSESQSPSGSLVGFGEAETPRGISDSEPLSTMSRLATTTASHTFTQVPSATRTTRKGRRDRRSRRPRESGRTVTRTPLPPFCR